MSDLVTRPSRGTVPETVDRFLQLLDVRGITRFAVVDHRAAAESVGLTLRDTTVVIFGNPKGGTPVMEAVPTAALDLPLKILVWDDAGQTKVSYLDPRRSRRATTSRASSRVHSQESSSWSTR